MYQQENLFLCIIIMLGWEKEQIFLQLIFKRFKFVFCISCASFYVSFFLSAALKELST